MFPFFKGDAFNRIWSFLAPKASNEGTTLTETQVNEVPSESPPLFALVIGINQYIAEDFENLDGAVADAEAMKSYLETSLGVPTSQIKTLFDAEATRNGIIGGLRGLANDPRIQPDDPILIFYAGHGSTAETPVGWDAGGPEIQILVSHDSLSDVDGNTIVGVPDRTVGILLEEIARKKGDNITVIFDCCHSGSMTRNPVHHPTRKIRGVKMPIKIPQDLDRDIWGGNRGTSIAGGFLKTGLRSHVLLSACGVEENAKEEKGRGYFTKRLLDTLVTVGADKVTYTDLVQRIPCSPWQNPQCEGFNRERICFDAKAPERSNRLYPVKKVGQRYIMDAGTAHGITDGAVFAIHNDRNLALGQAPVATLTASHPGAFKTVLVDISDGNQPDTDGEAFALLIRAGKQEDLRIHIEADEKHRGFIQDLVDDMQIEDPARPSIMLTDKSAASLDIALENNLLAFNILDPLVTMNGLNQMPFSIEPTIKSIRPVLRAAAHYFWHLHRNGNASALQSKIDIEFTRLEQLEEEYDDNLNPIMKPCGENLLMDGVVDLNVDDEAIYGIKITNKLNRPLYVSVFYFDNSDLSISSYYEPPIAAGKVDPPLPPYSSITIGYGAGGGSPFEYVLRDGQDIDVGFIKLFLSTQQVDLSSVPQLSPFETGNRGKPPPKPKPVGLWHTVLLTVVQRRNTSGSMDID